MADDINLAAPAGNAATDDIGGRHYQWVKFGWGPNGVINEVADTIGKELPVKIADSQISPKGQNTVANSVPIVPAGMLYESVLASQTAVVLGPGSGAVGDYMSHVLVIPTTTSPGNVLLIDNATSITIFDGGATSVSNLIPFTIPLGMFSTSGAWKITTGANVKIVAVGDWS